MFVVFGVFGHGAGRAEREEEKEKGVLQMTEPSRTASKENYIELL
jgi:hypothetical protein